MVIIPSTTVIPKAGARTSRSTSRKFLPKALTECRSQRALKPQDQASHRASRSWPSHFTAAIFSKASDSFSLSRRALTWCRSQSGRPSCERLCQGSLFCQCNSTHLWNLLPKGCPSAPYQPRYNHGQREDQMHRKRIATVARKYGSSSRRIGKSSFG
jgi:hypothetical protein